MAMNGVRACVCVGKRGALVGGGGRDVRGGHEQEKKNRRQ